jgi:hypothetical protein
MSVRRNWTCLGAPVDSLGCDPGAPPFGTELAPAALRARDLVSRLGAADHGDTDVRITGPDRDPESGMVGWPSVGAMTAATTAWRDSPLAATTPARIPAATAVTSFPAAWFAPLANLLP